ncbi:hypothetical protein A7K91_15030 [Paenibacillus oryzae]|uniref:DUF4136 domain-containing protein n=1 Tax=Paenibacillus oryzae TaxID=1844972 RepID=A0A1A5YTQ8_9BACL|nr:hypothetical protein [Paenibacillus oryzae]OBR68939.1 hypothetical protein A7K91_15030 [Paenibacillus oryzae]
MIKKVFTLLLLIILTGCASSEEYSDDFNFVFSYGVMNKNVLNTFDNRYTKDLVKDGVRTIELILTKEEKKIIYTYMKEIGLFQYPDEVEGMKMKPDSGYMFEINNDGIKRSINWVGEFNNSERDKEFKHLTRMIIELIESKESYQSLPKSSGYYE